MPENEVITLESYATVIAGLGAGLPLLRALEHANVRPLEWNVASEHWHARIDESAESDLSLLVAFDGALLSAKRRFEPTVEPIESDARAWTNFRRHFVTAVEPIAFLAHHGISLSMYARLEADWANRMLCDESLAAKLQKHMEAPLEDCPSITLTPSALLVARNAEEPTPQAAQVLVVPAISVETEESSFLANVMSQAAAAPPLVPSVPLAIQVPLAAEDPAGMTMFLGESPFSGPALPFDATAKPIIDAKPINGPKPGHLSTREVDPAETQAWSLVSETMRRQVAVMPFESPPVGETLDVTQFVTSDVYKQAVMPFDPTAPSSITPSVTKDKSSATVARVDPPANSPRAFDPGSTLFGPGIPNASVTPFDKPAVTAIPPMHPRPSETPILPLERYASLCVEFIMAPAQVPQIAARYRMTSALWAQVDAYWRARMTSEPDVRLAWEKACVTYRDWLLRR